MGGIQNVIMQHESYSNERKRFIDFHIYLDVDYFDEIPIDAVIHKVIVFEKYTQFKRYYDTTLRSLNYTTAYYGECIFKPKTCEFVFESRQLFKKKQFEQIKKLQIEQQLNNKRRPIQNIRRVKKIKTKTKAADLPILERMRLGLADDSDSSSSDSESSNPTNNGNGRKPKRTKTARKKILEQNKTNISDEAMIEMKKICKRLNIGKPPKIDSRLYYFGSHFEAYKCIDKLFQNHDNESFKQYVNGQKQSFCRDVKYALYTKGQIVPLSLMKENICKRFNELKPYYKNDNVVRRTGNMF